MFERLLEQRWAVCAVLSDRNVTKLADARTLDLKVEHWETVEELTPVLKSLKCATTTMCSETHVSSSMVYPITHSLITRHLNTQRSESPRVSEFKNAVAESLKTAHSRSCWRCWESVSASYCSGFGSKTQTSQVSWDRASGESKRESEAALRDNPKYCQTHTK